MSMSLETTNYKIPYWDGKDIPQLAVDVPAMANKIDSVIKQNLPDVTDIENQLKNLTTTKADKTALATTDNNLANFENYFNLSKTGTISITETSRSGVYTAVTSGLSYALNSSNSFGKIYGWVWIDINSSNTTDQIIIPTSLNIGALDSNFTINTGASPVYVTSTKSVYTSNFWNVYLQFSSTGLMSIRINGGTSVKGGSIQISLPASCYFLKNFGDN